MPASHWDFYLLRSGSREVKFMTPNHQLTQAESPLPRPPPAVGHLRMGLYYWRAGVGQCRGLGTLCPAPDRTKS